MVQGDTLQWVISGIPLGATVTTQVWFDVDSDGIVSPSTDLLISLGSQTDGGGSSGTLTRDMDGSANGIIYDAVPVILPIAHYVWKSMYGTDSASATVNVTAMPSPTYTIRGTVKESGVGVPNIMVQSNSSHNFQSNALTDANGNYTINTKATTGTQYFVQVWSLSIPSGYTASPAEDTVTLNANVTGIDFVLAGATGVDESRHPTSMFRLHQNYPNPFNPSTNISFYVPSRSFVSLKVFDILGSEVATLVSEEMPPGEYSRQWNAAGLTSGVYFYRITAGLFSDVKKLVLMK